MQLMNTELCVMKNRILLLCACGHLLLWGCHFARAQEMTLGEAIGLARSSSVQALKARQAFISSYWSWRSYQASRLPSIILYGNIANFNRSLTLLQNPDDGSMSYVSSYNLQNNIGLQLRQNIAWTGGTLNLYTDLNRIDQFGAAKALTWYAQPITLSYSQPLFTYNQFKWDKRIEPKEYERSKRVYLESMEQVSLDAVTAYFNLMYAQEDEKAAQTNLANTARLIQIAGERLNLGTITRDEYLQLELRMLNDSLAIYESALNKREAQMVLNTLLGLNDSFQVSTVSDSDLPVLQLDYEVVLEKALQNSRFNLDNEISRLNAESSVEKAKAQRGITVSFHARFGLSKSAPDIKSTYLDPLDQEVFGLSFSVPIFDWGVGKGRVQKAKAAREVTQAQIRQNEDDYRRRLFMAVGQLNRQGNQCSISRSAMMIAAERFRLMMDKFRSGSASVLEMNTARSENDAARLNYLGDLGRFWEYYYTLRKETLFDFFTGNDISIDEKELLQDYE